MLMIVVLGPMACRSQPKLGTYIPVCALPNAFTMHCHSAATGEGVGESLRSPKVEVRDREIRDSKRPRTPKQNGKPICVHVGASLLQHDEAERKREGEQR